MCVCSKETGKAPASILRASKTRPRVGIAERDTPLATSAAQLKTRPTTHMHCSNWILKRTHLGLDPGAWLVSPGPVALPQVLTQTRPMSRSSVGPVRIVMEPEARGLHGAANFTHMWLCDQTASQH